MIKLKNSLVVGAILILIAIALVAFGIWRQYQKQLAKFEPSPLPTPVQGFAPSPEAKRADQIPQTLPEAGSGNVTINNNGITLLEPQAAAQVSSPVKVAGIAAGFTNNIVIRIKEVSGKLLGASLIDECATVNPCYFERLVSFAKPAVINGLVEIYSPPSLGNTEEYLQSIVVKFK